MDRIWYVDDDEESFRLSERNLAKEFPQAEIRYFPTCEAAFDASEAVRPDVVILDERFPHSPMQGRQFLPQLRQRYRRVSIVMVTAHPTVELAVSVMRMGATDFLVKPFAPRDLLDCVHRSLAARRIERRAESLEEGPGPTEASFDGLVGSTEIMRDLMRRVEAAAPTDATVLITGETGTGKGLLAKYIHRLSARARGPFIDANLAATTEPLMESTLFGHERGAFTGAESRRLGKFEVAKGGTIFLDEIGDLSPTAQLKLLRVLEDGVFERVGGNELIKADVRVVAATNQDLPTRIAERKFREDLYFRLKVCQFHMPPLRRRMEDFDALIQYLLDRFNREYGRVVRKVHPDVLRRWREHRWPGNLRELAATVGEAVIHTVGEEVEPRVLWPDMTPEDDRLGVSLHALTRHLDLQQSILHLRRARIYPALDAWRKGSGDWNIRRTAQELGVSISTLQDNLVEDFVHGALAQANLDDHAACAAAVAERHGISADQAASLIRHGASRNKLKPPKDGSAFNES